MCMLSEYDYNPFNIISFYRKFKKIPEKLTNEQYFFEKGFRLNFNAIVSKIKVINFSTFIGYL